MTTRILLGMNCSYEGLNLFLDSSKHSGGLYFISRRSLVNIIASSMCFFVMPWGFITVDHSLYLFFRSLKNIGRFWFSFFSWHPKRGKKKRERHHVSQPKTSSKIKLWIYKRNWINTLTHISSKFIHWK